MEVSGIIEHIGETEVISAKFQKRLIVVETQDEKYPQLIPIEFTQDKVSMLDDLTEGEEITINVNLNGRKWTSPKGEDRYFLTLTGWRIGQPNQPVDPQRRADMVESAGQPRKPVPPSAPASDDSDDLPF